MNQSLKAQKIEKYLKNRYKYRLILTCVSAYNTTGIYDE
ncbi:hypothetical protein PRUB_a5105 [Pseudoalteromonas rubra]|uniref:Uncharacterized protein n=1 Tax=Pseudoalteromonas rubra TaxID=43658 RepID=A0A8T0C434_9GAMM|nr:hypothetical protein PRUB_a5105 [Pseudoalteromonas rubra]